MKLAVSQKSICFHYAFSSLGCGWGQLALHICFFLGSLRGWITCSGARGWLKFEINDCGSSDSVERWRSLREQRVRVSLLKWRGNPRVKYEPQNLSSHSLSETWCRLISLHFLFFFFYFNISSVKSKECYSQICCGRLCSVWQFADNLVNGGERPTKLWAFYSIWTDVAMHGLDEEGPL